MRFKDRLWDLTFGDEKALETVWKLAGKAIPFLARFQASKARTTVLLGTIGILASSLGYTVFEGQAETLVEAVERLEAEKAALSLEVDQQRALTAAAMQQLEE